MRVTRSIATAATALVMVASTFAAGATSAKASSDPSDGTTVATSADYYPPETPVPAPASPLPAEMDGNTDFQVEGTPIPLGSALTQAQWDSMGLPTGAVVERSLAGDPAADSPLMAVIRQGVSPYDSPFVQQSYAKCVMMSQNCPGGSITNAKVKYRWWGLLTIYFNKYETHLIENNRGTCIALVTAISPPESAILIPGCEWLHAAASTARAHGRCLAGQTFGGTYVVFSYKGRYCR